MAGISLLLAVGILVAIFVGFNIGGSSTGVAFGPAVGSGVISKVNAAILMTIFTLLGGWIVGRYVVETLGGEIVPAGLFSLEVSIAVLFFIGLSLFFSNIFGVPASTSMTAVGAIAGLGLATDQLNWGVMGRIVSWWLVSPIIAFWVSGIIGRYFYPRLVEWFAIAQTEGALLTFEWNGPLPTPKLGPNTTTREFIGSISVIAIACYMAFSAGASNVANAVAPLVGSNEISMNAGILLASGAMGVGAFTIARRTIDTMGNDLTEMPLVAALVVAVVSASLVTFLSWIGIPASFVVIATMAIIGLGWGRATRTATLTDTVAGRRRPAASIGALAADAEDAPRVGGARGGSTGDHAPPIGKETPEDIPKATDLFEPRTTARVLFLQNFVPTIATIAAYLLFRIIPVG